jgi:hypothetical protein
MELMEQTQLIIYTKILFFAITCLELQLQQNDPVSSSINLKLNEKFELLFTDVEFLHSEQYEIS